MPVALHRRIGQLVVVGFNGKAIPKELCGLAREFDLGGVILFSRNVESPEQVASVAVEAQQLARDLPLWVGVDQEGGRVARLKRPFTEWPAMAALGRAADESLASRFAGALARELLAVGISIDFAPVLDVLTNPKNPAIGDRALGDRADAVARLGSAIVRALQSSGLAACGKHFPGHGDTGVDSHLDLPVVEHPPDRLQAVDFVPFRAAMEAGVAAIMTGHLLVPSLDEQSPATLSRRIVTDVLRGDLGLRRPRVHRRSRHEGHLGADHERACGGGRHPCRVRRGAAVRRGRRGTRLLDRSADSRGGGGGHPLGACGGCAVAPEACEGTVRVDERHDAGPPLAAETRGRTARDHRL